MFSKTCECCVNTGCVGCHRDDFTGAPEFVQSVEKIHILLVAPFYETIFVNPPKDNDNDPQSMGVFLLPIKVPADGSHRSSALR